MMLHLGAGSDRCGVVASLVRSKGPGVHQDSGFRAREKELTSSSCVVVYFAASGGLLTYENNWKIATE